MDKNERILVSHPKGLEYNVWIIDLEKAKNIVAKHNGILIINSSKPGGLHNVYLLDNDQVVLFSHIDAIVFSSYDGYLLDKESQDNTIKKINKSFPKDRQFVTKDFEIINYSEINQRDFNSIIKDKKLSSNSFKGYGTFWELPSEEVIFKRKHNSFYIRFKSNSDFKTFLSYNDDFKANIKIPILCGLNPYGESFPEYVDKLIISLSTLLEIKTSSLDFTTKSLRKLNSVVFNNIINDSFRINLMLPLTAYLGRMAIVKCNDEWIMEYNKEFNTWTPSLKSEKYAYQLFYNKLYDLLSPDQESYLPLLSAAPFIVKINAQKI